MTKVTTDVTVARPFDKPLTEREERMLWLRVDGNTYEYIGLQFDVPWVRACQIIRKAMLKVADQNARLREEAATPKRVEVLREMVAEYGCITAKGWCRYFKASGQCVFRDVAKVGDVIPCTRPREEASP